MPSELMALIKTSPKVLTKFIIDSLVTTSLMKVMVEQELNGDPEEPLESVPTIITFPKMHMPLRQKEWGTRC